jgi:hypothetical protein
MKRQSKVELSLLVLVLGVIGGVAYWSKAASQSPNPASNAAEATGTEVLPAVPAPPAEARTEAADAPPPLDVTGREAAGDEDPAKADRASEKGAWRESFATGESLVKKGDIFQARKPLTKAILAAPEGEAREHQLVT